MYKLGKGNKPADPGMKKKDRNRTKSAKIKALKINKTKHSQLCAQLVQTNDN